LAISDGDSSAIGRPSLPNASVRAKIVQAAARHQGAGVQEKKRKNYRRKRGHRQELTVLRIEEISRGA